VIKAVRKDKPELVACSARSWTTSPRLGPAINRAAATTTTMHKIIQHRQATAHAATTLATLSPDPRKGHEQRNWSGVLLYWTLTTGPADDGDAAW
jgi:hypothetical protein